MVATRLANHQENQTDIITIKNLGSNPHYGPTATIPEEELRKRLIVIRVPKSTGKSKLLLL